MSNNKSLIEIAVELMKSKRGAKKLSEIIKEVATVKGYSTEDFEPKVGAFFADMVASGKFVYLGENVWDLKERQPFKMSEYDFVITGEIEDYVEAEDEVSKKSGKKGKDDLEDSIEEDDSESIDEDEFNYPDNEYEDDYGDGDAKE